MHLASGPYPVARTHGPVDDLHYLGGVAGSAGPQGFDDDFLGPVRECLLVKLNRAGKSGGRGAFGGGCGRFYPERGNEADGCKRSRAATDQGASGERFPARELPFSLCHVGKSSLPR